MLLAIVTCALAANPYLDDGASLFDRMLYEKAVAKLKRATAVNTSTEAERRRAHDLLARSLVALGQNDEARRTFVALLSVDPRAPLPGDASPTIRRLFLDAKEQLYPKGRAQLRRVPAPAPRLTVELVDPWDAVARVELRLEPSATLTLEPGAVMNAELPEGTREATVVALSASDEPVATLGPLAFEAAAPPAAVAITEEPPPPPSPKWPVIATGAVSMALLVAGAALSVAAGADSSTAAQQRFASEIRRYDDNARDKGIAGAVLLGAAAAGGVATAVIYFKW